MSLDKNILVKLKDAGFRQNDKWLVKGVSLVVEKGKIVTLIGPNGSGKSTTAKIALGIYKKIDGEVEKYTNKVYMLPKKLDEKVAMLHLDALGVELDKLNKTQSNYLGLDIEGPFKPDYYRY